VAASVPVVERHVHTIVRVDAVPDITHDLVGDHGVTDAAAVANRSPDLVAACAAVGDDIGDMPGLEEVEEDDLPNLFEEDMLDDADFPVHVGELCSMKMVEESPVIGPYQHGRSMNDKQFSFDLIMPAREPIPHDQANRFGYSAFNRDAYALHPVFEMRLLIDFSMCLSMSE
jgi:hypothetical protein